jgi:peptidyl-prolyl cis-trans isomerase SurA
MLSVRLMIPGKQGSMSIVELSRQAGLLAARACIHKNKKDVMKKVLFVLFAAITAWLASVSGAFASGKPDGIVAIVGREIILESDVNEQELMFRLQVPEARNEPQLRKQIIENMINQKILLTKARIDSVSVDEKSIDDMAAAKYNSLRAGFPSVNDMAARFSLPVNRLKQHIREDIRNQQMIDALRRKRYKDVTVTYGETMAFYQKEKEKLSEVPEEISVSQILRYPEISDAEKQRAFEKIKAMQEQLASGGNFASLAREYSDDPGSRDLGGDLGFVQKGALVPSFEKAAFALKPGQLSDPVESRFGYHLIQMIDREDSRIHVRHILAMFDRSKTDIPQTFALLQSIRADVLSGKTTFAAMAEKYSEEPESMKNGGLIKSESGSPLVELTSLRPELQKIVGGLKSVGDISQPEKIQPSKGEPFFALFRLNSREPAHVLNPERDFTRLEELATNNKRQELFNAWIESLKKEVMVQVMSDI